MNPQANSGLRRAANEAAALALVTPFPLLVFPGLFQEKADKASQATDLRKPRGEPKPGLLPC